MKYLIKMDKELFLLNKTISAQKPIHQSEIDKNENLRQLPFWK